MPSGTATMPPPSKNTYYNIEIENEKKNEEEEENLEKNLRVQK